MKTFLVIDTFMNNRHYYGIPENQLKSFMYDLWPQCDDFTDAAIDELITMKLYEGNRNDYVCRSCYPNSLFYGLGTHSGKSGEIHFFEHMCNLEDFLFVRIYEEI